MNVVSNIKCIKKISHLYMHQKVNGYNIWKKIVTQYNKGLIIEMNGQDK